MKKISILLLISLCLLTSCSKKEEEEVISDETTIEEVKKIESIEIFGDKEEYKLSEKVTLQFKSYPEDVDITYIDWQSSDESICTVNSGDLTFMKEGKCTITLTVNDMNESIDISIVDDTEKVSYIPEKEDKTEEVKSSTSANGFEIKEIDGITYVDGILIANKTYTLPESYNPGDIIDEAMDAFEVMQKAASEEDLNIFIVSGFRSYEYQKGLYQRYCNRDGQEAADTYSARAGHSEHQTGLCMDINEVKYAFGDTEEGKWVAEHACEYGFIIRYPKGKEDLTGYNYEPWHIRYLGVEVATKVYESGLCLEEYLGITSKYQD